MSEETSVCFSEEEWDDFVTEYELDIESEVGIGTTVTLMFPFTENQQAH